MKADGNPLAQNELGRKLTTWADRIEPHTNKILAALLFLTVVVVGVMVFRRSGSANATKAWTEFYECQTPADYETFLEDFPNSPATAWGRIEAARQRMFEGYRTSLTNRADSVKALKKSQEHYRALLQGDAPPEIRERGLAGLAMVNEALCDGDTKPVVEAYKQLLQEFPETYYKKWVEHRLEELNRPETAEFYAWYAKQDPKPTDRPAPRDGRPVIPGAGDLPDLSELFNKDLMKDAKVAPAPDAKAPADPAKPGDEARPVVPPKPGQPTEKTPDEPPAAAPAKAPATTAPETPAKEPAPPATETPVTDPAKP